MTDDKVKDSTAAKKGDNPLLDKFVAQGGGAILAIVDPKDTSAINSYFKRTDIRALLPADKRYAKFVWGKPSVNVDEKTKKPVTTVEFICFKRKQEIM